MHSAPFKLNEWLKLYNFSIHDAFCHLCLQKLEAAFTKVLRSMNIKVQEERLASAEKEINWEKQTKFLREQLEKEITDNKVSKSGFNYIKLVMRKSVMDLP
jgi:hypothetical protein